MVGTTIENAAQEQEKSGTGKNATWVQKYQMDDLLDPEFRLKPPPTKKEREQSAVKGLIAFAASSGGGVRYFKQKKADG